MAELEKIRVMVSSRSAMDVFATGESLATVRKNLQTYLHSIRWSSSRKSIGRPEPLFDVWIHEDETGVAANRSVFQLSLDEIGRADIILVLYTGDAGSVVVERSMGICHAELQAAIARRPEIVFMIRLQPFHTDGSGNDAAFQHYVNSLSIFKKDAASEKELHKVVSEMLQNVVIRLAARGSSTSSGKLDRGQALQWNLLNLSARREEMRKALAHHLEARAFLDTTDDPVFEISLSGSKLLARLDAIPAAVTVPAARELVGQPFLRDHLHAPLLSSNDLIGPLHIIACHRTITESQAAKMIGTPDSMVVASDFGIYVADHVQKIQIVLLARCADEAATQVMIRRFVEWLRTAGEGRSMVDRAKSRRRILEAVAAEQSSVLSRAGKPSSSEKERRK